MALQGLVDALLADVAAVQQQLQDTQQELQQMQAQNKEVSKSHITADRHALCPPPTPHQPPMC